MTDKRGNCYVTSEALYHLLGGKESGWKPMRVKMSNDTHWFLQNIHTGQRLDVTAMQFTDEFPDYTSAVGAGFLTAQPSKRAIALMDKMLWQDTIRITKRSKHV